MSQLGRCSATWVRLAASQVRRVRRTAALRSLAQFSCCTQHTMSPISSTRPSLTAVTLCPSQRLSTCAPTLQVREMKQGPTASACTSSVSPQYELEDLESTSAMQQNQRGIDAHRMAWWDASIKERSKQLRTSPLWKGRLLSLAHALSDDIAATAATIAKLPRPRTKDANKEFEWHHLHQMARLDDMGVTWSRIANMLDVLGACGQAHLCLRILRHMIALESAYVAHGCHNMLSQLPYCLAQRHFSSVVHACSLRGMSSVAERTFAKAAQRADFTPHAATLLELTSAYARAGDVARCRRVILQTVAVYGLELSYMQHTQLIRAYGRSGDLEGAVETFEHIYQHVGARRVHTATSKDAHWQRDEFQKTAEYTYSASEVSEDVTMKEGVIGTTTPQRPQQLPQGQQADNQGGLQGTEVKLELIKEETMLAQPHCSPPTSSSSSSLTATEELVSTANESVGPDHIPYEGQSLSTAYRFLMEAYALAQQPHHVHTLFEHMLDQQLPITAHVYQTLATAARIAEDSDAALAYLEHAIQHNHELSVKVFNTTLHTFAMQGDCVGVARLIELMKDNHFEPNISTFELVIQGFVHAQDLSSALNMYERMFVDPKTQIVTQSNSTTSSLSTLDDSQAVPETLDTEPVSAPFTPTRVLHEALFKACVAHNDLEAAGMIVLRMLAHGQTPHDKSVFSPKVMQAIARATATAINAH
eukprot:m.142057 g.142057  ORF g.142057 m.142057 type:complete len:704 (-) comp14048_c0_seq2:1202-3313(-)